MKTLYSDAHPAPTSWDEVWYFSRLCSVGYVFCIPRVFTRVDLSGMFRECCFWRGTRLTHALSAPVGNSLWCHVPLSYDMGYSPGAGGIRAICASVISPNVFFSELERREVSTSMLSSLRCPKRSRHYA